jgi:hypothetical protein
MSINDWPWTRLCITAARAYSWHSRIIELSHFLTVQERVSNKARLFTLASHFQIVVAA